MPSRRNFARGVFHPDAPHLFVQYAKDRIRQQLLQWKDHPLLSAVGRFTMFPIRGLQNLIPRPVTTRQTIHHFYQLYPDASHVAFPAQAAKQGWNHPVEHTLETSPAVNQSCEHFIHCMREEYSKFRTVFYLCCAVSSLREWFPTASGVSETPSSLSIFWRRICGGPGRSDCISFFSCRLLRLCLVDSPALGRVLHEAVSSASDELKTSWESLLRGIQAEGTGGPATVIASSTMATSICEELFQRVLRGPSPDGKGTESMRELLTSLMLKRQAPSAEGRRQGGGGGGNDAEAELQFDLLHDAWMRALSRWESLQGLEPASTFMAPPLFPGFLLISFFPLQVAP